MRISTGKTTQLNPMLYANVIRTSISAECSNRTIPVKLSFSSSVEIGWAYLNSNDQDVDEMCKEFD
jgi:hypothetical protein